MHTSRFRATTVMALILTLVLTTTALAVVGITAGGAGAQDDPGSSGTPAAQPATPDRDARTGRLSGPTRIDTAVEIARRAFPTGAPTAYLADAATAVDAVAGGSLTDGPVLLVPHCELPTAVAEELARLQPDEVIALGGPAAVCDEVLSAAGFAASGEIREPGARADVVVTASAELVDPSSRPPFTVGVADPGRVVEGGAVAHELTITSTDGTVALDDPRFSEVLRGGGGDGGEGDGGEGDGGAGQLVVTGRGCSPIAEDDQAQIACQEDFLIVVAEPGQPASTELTLHTDDARVGSTPLLAGTYVLEQPVRWDTDSTDGEVDFDDGSAIVRVTYTVRPVDSSDSPAQPREAVVEWETPEGTFHTTGHSDADLARIHEGVTAGAHIGIPNGRIHPGDGGVNTGHEWHLTDVELAEVTTEACDGTAAYVDANLEDFLDLGHYCPWSAVPIGITG